MSSEAMRTELESFVNQGLREGWRGWPLKGPEEALRGGFCVARTTVGESRGLRAGFEAEAASMAFVGLTSRLQVSLS